MERGLNTFRAIGKSVVSAALTGPVSYFLGKVAESWGILDPFANKLGGWLKLNVSSGDAALVASVVIFAVLYGIVLWRVWRPRHVHHLPINGEIRPEATLRAELQQAPPPTVEQHHSGTGHNIYGNNVQVNQEPEPPPQRHLTDDQKRVILETLKSRDKGSMVVLSFNSREQWGYAHSLKDVFQGAGWETQTMLVGERPPMGRMRVAGDSENVCFRAAVEALRAANVDFVEATQETNLDVDVGITAGGIEMTNFQQAADRLH